MSDSAQGPIFVVGMNGSGTTMMLDHLNSHPAVYGYPEETRVLPHFLGTAARYGDLSIDENLHRLWQDMCKAFPFWRSNGEVPVPIPDDWRDAARNPAEIFDWILGYFAEKQHKPIWCEKTPMHALHMASIAERLPTARFVHMIRDGRDCAASFRRRWGYDPKVTIFRWRKTIAEARRQAASIDDGRYTEVRFEELTTEPEPVLRNLLEFLKLDFDGAVLASSRDTGRNRGISSAELRPNSGAFKSFFTAKQLDGLERVAGAMLHELGYEANNPNGNKDLSGFYLQLRQLPTYLARLRDVARRARGSKNPWKLFVGRIRSGLAHLRANRF